MDAVPGADTPSSAPQTEAVSFMWNGIDEPMAVAVGNSVEDSDAAPSGDAADHPTTATAPQSDVEVLEAGATPVARCAQALLAVRTSIPLVTPSILAVRCNITAMADAFCRRYCCRF